MRYSKISGEAKEFIKALKFMESNEGKELSKIMDGETVLLYKIWHNIISTECGEIYSKEKIREIKKNLLNKSKKQIEQLQSIKIIGYDNSLELINQTEESMMNNLENTIQYINNIDEKDLIDLILESVFTSKENMEILLQQKTQMEQEKFEELSYKGQKCVEGETINDELLKKIYNEIKGKGLNLISKRVEKTVNSNKQFINFHKIKLNAENIIIYEIAKIYEEKIEKIESEIKQELEKMSKSKYADYIKSDNINLIRLREQLKTDYKNSKKGIKNLFNKQKQNKINEVLSTVKGTIKHKETLEEYMKRLKDFKMEPDLKEAYAKTQMSRQIREQKEEILRCTGIIINNITDDIIKLYREELKAEIICAIEESKSKITETCTQEEKSEIESFAKIIGMSIENALKFLRNENSIYACLYTYLFGTEIKKGIDNNSAPEILSELDPRWKYKNTKIETIIDQTYLKENTKSLQEKSPIKLKLPYKK